MPQISNLASTVTAASLAAALVTLLGPYYRQHFGADLTVDQTSALVAVAAGLLHWITTVPSQIVTWRAAWNAAKSATPVASALLVAVLLAAGLSACADLSVPTGRPPLTTEQTALLDLDAGLSDAGIANDAYAASSIADPAIEALIVKALASASAAANAADVPVFGCPRATWRDPSQACGQPAEDKSVLARAVTDVSAAITAAKAVIPVIKQ
jgi:hypothetical protein